MRRRFSPKSRFVGKQTSKPPIRSPNSLPCRLSRSLRRTKHMHQTNWMVESPPKSTDPPLYPPLHVIRFQNNSGLSMKHPRQHCVGRRCSLIYYIAQVEIYSREPGLCDLHQRDPKRCDECGNQSHGLAKEVVGSVR